MGECIITSSLLAIVSYLSLKIFSVMVWVFWRLFNSMAQTLRVLGRRELRASITDLDENNIATK